MTQHAVPHDPSSSSRAVAGVTWLVASLVVGVLGWLLFAVSDHQPERTAGVVLLAAAVLGALTTVVVLRGRGSSPLPTVTSVAFAVAGVASAALLLLAGDGRTVFVVDVLLAGGVPALAAVMTFLVGRRRG